MKKCIVISDSFKGTLSSLAICRMAEESIHRFFPDCQVVSLPVADGGEGTVDCFAHALGAEVIAVPVTGPFGEPVSAAYCRQGDRAVVEMAAAAGLPLAGERRDPETSTTFGVGELIRAAVESGCTKLLLGLGGSCTNDGGCGCAAALGVRFFDAEGRAFIPVGGTLDQIARIDKTAAERLLRGVSITVMCDVENPLYGPNGAAFVFAPQKGADAAMTERLDGQLRAFGETVERETGVSVAQKPGAGAAGGMGAGCVAFFGAELQSGIEAVLDAVGFEEKLEGVELVLTGEGRIDAQSVQGKVISGVAKRTKPRGIPLIALVGGIAEGAEAAYNMGVTAMFGTNREAVAFAQCKDKAAENYRRTLEDILRLLAALEKRGT